MTADAASRSSGLSGNGTGRRPRVAVLWTGLSGFLHASLHALVLEGVEVLVFRREPTTTAPFDSEAITTGLRVESWSEKPDPDLIMEELETFDPDAVLICSWHIGGYREVGRRLRGRTLRVLSLSNQWFSTLKQWGGVLTSPFVIRPTYDAAFVCGERQATFASKLGFSTEQLIWGLNSCDHALYAKVAHDRGEALPPRTFLFVGRLVPAKAIDVLAAGYEQYRQEAEDPWPLLVAGLGPHEHLLSGLEGVEMQGFVQPGELPELFKRAGCLVLPSRFEPWGVVVHEATAAGLPVITTHVTGASTRLVLDGYNGVVISHDDSSALTAALKRVHAASDGTRAAMGQASESLALQYTPERWAKNFLQRIPELRRRAELPDASWVD